MRTSGRGMGEKILRYFVKKPFRKEFDPGEASEAFSTLAVFATPPLAVPKRAWIRVQGIQVESDAVTAAGISEIRFGANSVHKNGALLADNGDYADWFSVDREDGDYDTNTSAGTISEDELEAYGQTGTAQDETYEDMFWWRHTRMHDYRSLVVTEENKGRHFFTAYFGKRRGVRLWDLTEADWEEPTIVWLGAAIGAQISASATDQTDAVSGNMSPADLYRELVLHGGAYRNPSNTAGTLFGQSGYSDALTKYLSYGSEYKTDLTNDTDALEKNFVVFGQMTVAVDLYAGQRGSVLSITR